MNILLGRNEIIVKGISTHNKAQSILIELREYIETRDRRINVLFKGSPGPWGEGLCLRIKIDGKPLGDLEIKALEKFFKIRGGFVEIV